MYAGGGCVNGEAATGPTGTAAGGGVPTSSAPQFWQNLLPSGLAVLHRAQIIATVQALRVAVAPRSRRLRLMCDGAAVRARPQLGQNPDATMCMWQLGHTVSAKPM